MLTCLNACACTPKQMPDPEPGPFIRYASDIALQSKILGRAVNFDILLPADYLSEPDKRYPVVYMCHGYGDNNKSWNDKWLKVEEKVNSLEAEGLEPMIYVFPNAFKSYYVNRYTGKFNYMDMFIEELIPYIDKTYRTIPDREHRATVGYSMGGFGACVLPEKHPETFLVSVPLSMSFRTDAQYMTESQDGWNGQWGSIFGGEGLSGEGRLTDYYKAHCPLHQFTAENHDQLSKVRWFLHCGDDEEQLLIANDDLHVMMRDNGYDHEYRVADGAHTGGYWRACLNEVLPYIQFCFNGGKQWERTDRTPQVQQITLDGNSCFVSSEYAAKGTGTAVYLTHKGLSPEVVKDIMSICQRGSSAKSFVIMPCDLNAKTLKDWMAFYEQKYDVSGKQAIAIGDAGSAVYELGDKFSRIYFENASVCEDPSAITLDPSVFYYIGQTDNGPHYRDMCGMYKACKAQGAQFEYRVRNDGPDAEKSLLEAFEIMKSYLKF